MYEKNAMHTEALDRLTEAFADTKRGTLVPWEKVETLLRLSRFRPDGRYVIAKFVKWMRLKRRVIVRQVPKEGLRFLTDAENARETPVYRGKRAYRQTNRLVREVACVDTSKLTQHERRVLASNIEAARRNRLEIGRSLRNVEVALKPSESNFAARTK